MATKKAKKAAQAFTKTVNFTFDHNADNLTAALGISEERSTEIGTELQTVFSGDLPAADKAQKVFSTYEGNEFIWALLNLQAAEMGSIIGAGDEMVGVGDDSEEGDC